LNKRLNRRFRKQVGGLLIRGSQVRILPGAIRKRPLGLAARALRLHLLGTIVSCGADKVCRLREPAIGGRP
jgi:hypothetical protein